MSTIKDIARAAGVSHGTVSNVLNKTGKVSSEKIRLVEEAALRLGYVPNAQAKRLRQGKATTVAVILPSLHHDTYLDLYTTLQDVLGKAGYETSVYVTDDIPGNEERILERLPLSTIAAIVSVSCLGERGGAAYGALGLPAVFVDREVAPPGKESAFVSFDFSTAGGALGEWVLSRGFRNVAVFSESSAFTNTRRFLSGLSGVLGNAGVAFECFTSDMNLVINKAFDIVQGDAAFDAIIATGTHRADGIASALRFCAEKKQPALISLGAYRHISAHPFTVYALDYRQMGVRISEMLERHLIKNSPLPGDTELRANGIPFRFPMLKKCAPGTLTMLTLDSPTIGALEKISPMFTELTGIALKIFSMPYADLLAHIKALGEGYSYDLIRMDVAWLDALGPEVYLPLVEVGLSQGALDGTFAGCVGDIYSSVDGVPYTLPFDPSVQILLYRSDLFEDAKLKRAYYEKYREPLCVPNTTERLLRVAEFFTRRFNPQSPTEYGTTLTCGSAATTASDFLPHYLAREPRLIEENGAVRLDTPQMVRALEIYMQLASFASRQQWWGDSVRRLAEGSTATTMIYSNYASYVINSKHSNVVGKIGAAAVPGGRPLLGGGIVGVSKLSRNIEACRQFFRWYYAPEVASMLVRLGGTSPILDAYGDFANASLYPWLETVKESLSIGCRGRRCGSHGYSIQRYEFAVGTAAHSLVHHGISAAQAASIAQALYDNNAPDMRGDGVGRSGWERTEGMPPT